MSSTGLISTASVTSLTTQSHSSAPWPNKDRWRSFGTNFSGSQHIPNSVLEDCTLLGPEVVEVDLALAFPRLCFWATQGIIATKPKGIIPICFAYQSLLSVMQGGQVPLSHLLDVSFPLESSTADRATAVGLASLKFSSAFWKLIFLNP